MTWANYQPQQSFGSWTPSWGPQQSFAPAGGVGFDPTPVPVASVLPPLGDSEPGGSSAGMPAWGGGGNTGGFDLLGSLKSFFGGAIGSTDKPGWGAPMLTAAGGLANAYLGMQQYGLAKDRLAEAKRQYNQEYQVNRQLTNSRLEDRQRARVASNSGAYQSVGDYMNQYGVK